MAYSKKKMTERAIKIIRKHKLLFIDEIFCHVSYCKATFYNKGLERLDSIKAEIEKNRIRKKIQMRDKWYESESATLQIGLYKLIGNEEENDKLANRSHIDHTSKGDKMDQNFIFEVVDDNKNK